MARYRPSDDQIHDVIRRLERASVSGDAAVERDRLLEGARRALLWDPANEAQRRGRGGAYDAAVAFRYQEDL
jgi:hypothetical protein